MSLLAATTLTAASTGPAHGTKTRPSESPSRKPPPLARRRVSGAKGRSSSSAKRGKRSVAATTKSSASARFRSRSFGSPRRSRTHVAKSVKLVNPTTSPATIRSGLRPLAPPASRIGRTGSTHGEIAVTIPARRPIQIRNSTTSRYRRDDYAPAKRRRRGSGGLGRHGRLRGGRRVGSRRCGRVTAVLGSGRLLAPAPPLRRSLAGRCGRALGRGLGRGLVRGRGRGRRLSGRHLLLLGGSRRAAPLLLAPPAAGARGARLRLREVVGERRRDLLDRAEPLARLVEH